MKFDAQRIGFEQEIRRQDQHRHDHADNAKHALEGARDLRDCRTRIRQLRDDVGRRPPLAQHARALKRVLDHVEIPRQLLPQCAHLPHERRHDDREDQHDRQAEEQIEQEDRCPARERPARQLAEVTLEPAHGRAESDREQAADVEHQQHALDLDERPEEHATAKQSGDGKEDELPLARLRHYGRG